MKKRMLCTLITVLMLIGIMCVTAFAAEGDPDPGIQSGTWGGIDWTLDADGTLTIVPTTGTPVPDANCNLTYEVGEWREAVIYNSAGVGTSIGGWPYDCAKVKTVVIEEGVTSIGSFVLDGLSNVGGELIIPKTVTYIGQQAFRGCSFTKVTFEVDEDTKKSDLLCIAQGAFNGASKITEVVFPEGIRDIHASAFQACQNLETVHLPSTVKLMGAFNGHLDYSWAEKNDFSSIFAYSNNLRKVTFADEEIRDLFVNTGACDDICTTNKVATQVADIDAYNGLAAYVYVRDAIEEAQAGDTIILVSDPVASRNEPIVIGVNDVAVIPDGVTLVIPEGKTLTNNGILVSFGKIEGAGTIKNDATYAKGDNAELATTVTVQGELGDNKSYHITYDLNGGKVESANPGYYIVANNAILVNSEITLNSPLRYNHAFTEWQVNTAGGLALQGNTLTIPDGFSGDISLTADYYCDHYNPNNHCICGGKAVGIGAHTCASELTWMTWNGTDDITYINGEAFVYLNANVERDTALTVPSGYTLNLCLNGKTLTYTGTSDNSVIVVEEGATLNLTDCDESGKITGGTGSTIGSEETLYGGGIKNLGILNLYAGNISENSADYGGGVFNGGIFTMIGGSITGNDAEICGGGIYASASDSEELHMAGSPIVSGNTVADSANNLYLDNGMLIDFDGALVSDALIGVTLSTAFGNVAVNADVEDFSQYLTSDEEIPFHIVGDTLKLEYFIAEQPAFDNDFTATMNAETNLTYQWYLVGDENVPCGGTAKTLDTDSTEFGTYFCKITWNKGESNEYSWTTETVEYLPIVTLQYGIASETPTIMIVEPGTVLDLKDPVFDGYIFMGWYTDESFETAFDPATPITADTNLYANFASYTDDMADINDAIAGLEQAINAVNAALNEKASTANLTAAIDDLNDAIDTAESVAKAYTDETASALTAAIATAKAEAVTAAEELVNAAKAELLEKINQKVSSADLTAAIDDLNDAIDTAESVAKAYTDETATALTAAIATAKAEAVTAAEELVNAAKAELLEKINEKSSSADLTAAIDDLNDAIDTAESVAKAYTDETATALTAAIATAKAEAVTAAEELVNAAKAELLEKINEKSSSADLTAAIDDLNDAIDTAESVAKAYTDETATALTAAIATAKAEAVTAAEELVNAAKAELLEKINEKVSSADLTAAIDDLNDAIDTAESVAKAYTDETADALTAAIATAKAEAVTAAEELVNAAKAELLEKINEKVSSADLTAAIDDLNDAIDTAESVAKEYADAQDAALKEALEKAIVSAKDELEALIVGVQDNLDQAKVELDKAIENLDAAMKTGDTNLSAEIANLNTALANAKATLEKADADNKAELAKKIEDADKALDTAIQVVQKNLDDAKAELNTAIKNGNTALDEKITALNEALASAKAAFEAAEGDNKAEIIAKVNEAEEFLGAAIKALQKKLDDEKAALEAKDKELQTFVIVVCIISSISLCGCGAFVTWFFIDRKKKI